MQKTKHHIKHQYTLYLELLSTKHYKHTLKHYITQVELLLIKLDLEALFQERFKTTYQKEYTGTKTHFTNPVEMREFYDDGVAILNWIKKKSGGLFSIKNVRLLGIELPLIYKVSNNIYYKAFIDFALYDMDLNKLYIYDIKTSKGSWSDKQKKDNMDSMLNKSMSNFSSLSEKYLNNQNIQFPESKFPTPYIVTGKQIGRGHV